MFNVRTHVFLKDAFLILKRLESVFVLTPNQIAIENYFSQNLDYSAIDMSEKQLMLGRSSKIVDFFVSENDNISSDRFSFLLKGFEDEHWNKAQTINVSGEGIISIVLLSFKQ